ncbi:hypothetical protein ACIBI3_04210 [Actinomadura luteofluorescens]|uniref:hypothetical protein n=1 Tax=Actinomadura luteofluorescens TaxID=46163 RepID=UPI00347E24B0
MSDDTEPGRLDPRAAERLLDGAGGHAELRALLTAASAPGRPRELAGEDAAVAAFLAAPRPARSSRAAALRRFLTAKVIAVVGGSILLSGGVAFATGNFPGQDAAPGPSSTPHDRKTPKQGGGGSGSHPLHGPSTGPSPKPSSERGKSAGEHGKTTAPGQENKTTSPKAKATPPRGPGNSHGTTRPTTPSNSGNPNKKNGSQGSGSTGVAPESGTESGDSRSDVPLPSDGKSGR